MTIRAFAGCEPPRFGNKPLDHAAARATSMAMKAKAVSVLRERGFPPDVCRWAQPQCCELAFKQLIERKTDTMKTCILRDPNSVEPQKAQFLESIEPQNLPHPQTPTSLA